MATHMVRRLYIYVAAFVGLQMLCIGSGDLIIFVLERLISTAAMGASGMLALRLGGSVALVLVGLALWAGHWTLAQRDAREPEGRSSALRRLYGYAVLLVAVFTVLMQLQTALQVSLAAISTSLATAELIRALVRTLVAAMVWLAHWRIFATDRTEVECSGANAVLRRWYLVLVRWVSLVMGSVGAGLLIHALAQRLIFGAAGWRWQLTEPTAGLISGIIIWILHEIWARKLVQEPGPLQADELQSSLRQVYSALVLTVSLIALLSGLTALLAAGIRTIAGVIGWFAAFATETHGVAAVIVALPLLLYHRSQLLATAEISGAAERINTARRIILYLMAAVSLAALYFGLSGMFGIVLRIWLGDGVIRMVWHTTLSWYTATAIVALPVYAVVFRQSELLARSGIAEERVISRRIYLYAGLLFGVIGAAISGTRLIQLMVVAMMGEAGSSGAAQIGQFASYTGLSVLITVLYAFLLRRAGTVRETAGVGTTIALVLDATSSMSLAAAISRELPGATITTCATSDSAERRAVLAEADLLVITLAELRDPTLASFHGPCLLLAVPPKGFSLIGARREGPALLREAARTIRRLCLYPLPSNPSANVGRLALV
ncbi:MAG: hypothetical protein HC822_02675 [Oscillochloris sp.]|nr:hypothetical protein [Oscillochloris sp.]